MSEVIESLICQWIENDSPTSEFLEDFFDESYEDIKGYLPRSLKLQFKVLCTQKEVKIRVVLANLINRWIEITETSEE